MYRSCKTKINQRKFYGLFPEGKVINQIFKKIEFNFNKIDEPFTCDIRNMIFENVIFDNCAFNYSGFYKCVFLNCSFINCSFFDSSIEENHFTNCHFEGGTFDNNLHVAYNRFDRVTGYIHKYSAIMFFYNVFIDMDFSGFLPFYMESDNRARWNESYFINTTINLQSLIEMSQKCNTVRCGNLYGVKGMRRRVMDDELHPTMKKSSRRVIVDTFNEIPDIDLDISKLSNDAKLNIIAGMFTNYQAGEGIQVLEFNPIRIGEDSKIKHLTIPNPRPARIVDSRGYILNPGVIQDIVFEDTYENTVQNPYIFDCSKLGAYSYENSLRNPDNYSCHSVIVRKK